ncbi:MAG: SDR family NAD(P)-dependent oxidoreductase [Proteobacteria bacterium]|nr:SDR family NAD(P)-dependent oxidoreductase [Pseudomonadota bacterium]
MRIDMTGRRVLVTGGSRGIGRAVVALFHEAGARVAVNGASAQSTAAALAALGGGDRLVAAPGSVATLEGCRGVVETATSALGGLDVLVNNAGVADLVPVAVLDDAAVDVMFDVNVKGVLFCTRFAAPHLTASGGSIVNIASISALMGAAQDAVYAASKAAVIAITKCHALELAPRVRVNAVCPGSVDTDMLHGVAQAWHGDVAAGLEAFTHGEALRRIAQPREMAAPVLYLASDLASFVTGSVHVVDGGETID